MAFSKSPALHSSVDLCYYGLGRSESIAGTLGAVLSKPTKVPIKACKPAGILSGDSSNIVF